MAILQVVVFHMLEGLAVTLGFYFQVAQGASPCMLFFHLWCLCVVNVRISEGSLRPLCSARPVGKRRKGLRPGCTRLIDAIGRFKPATGCLLARSAFAATTIWCSLEGTRHIFMDVGGRLDPATVRLFTGGTLASSSLEGASGRGLLPFRW